MKTVERNGEIVSATRITARTEHYKELCLTISSLLDPIRREEGCRTYKFYREVGEQNSFMLIGEWETLPDWEHHLNSEPFAVLLGSLQLLSNRSNLDFRLMTPVAGMEALTRTRCVR